MYRQDAQRQGEVLTTPACFQCHVSQYPCLLITGKHIRTDWARYSSLSREDEKHSTQLGERELHLDRFSDSDW